MTKSYVVREFYETSSGYSPLRQCLCCESVRIHFTTHLPNVAANSSSLIRYSVKSLRLSLLREYTDISLKYPYFNNFPNFAKIE